MLGEGPGQNYCGINNNDNSNNNNNDNNDNVLSLPRLFIASVVQSYRPVWCQYCHFVPLSNERRERWYLPLASGSLISLVSSPGQQLERRDLQGKVKADDTYVHIYARVHIHSYVYVHVCVYSN